MKSLRPRFTLATSMAFIVSACMSATSTADVLVTNYFASSVQEYNDAGSNPRTLVASGSGGLSFPSGVTMGPDGNIYVSSSGTGQVLQYSSSGSFMSVFATLPEDYSPSLQTFVTASPAHLQFYNGSLYVSDNNGDSVQQFAVAKNPSTGALSAAATPTAAVSGLYGAGGFTFASNGDLYASSFAGPLYGDPSGSPPFVPAVVKVSNGVQTNFAYPATDTNGNTTSPVSPTDPNGLLYIHNTLLVVDLSGNNILRYDANGQYLGVFATIPGPNGVPNNFPSDLVLSRDGQSIDLAVLGDGNPLNPEDPNSTPDGKVLQYGFTIDSNGHVVASGSSPIVLASGFAASSIALAVQKGDFNLDGKVDAADISTMLAALANLPQYQSTHGLSSDELQVVGDVNGDGVINNADLQSLLNFLRAEGGASATTVPEPSAGLLAGLALMAVFHIHRRQSRK